MRNEAPDFIQQHKTAEHLSNFGLICGSLNFSTLCSRCLIQLMDWNLQNLCYGLMALVVFLLFDFGYCEIASANDKF